MGGTGGHLPAQLPSDSLLPAGTRMARVAFRLVVVGMLAIAAGITADALTEYRQCQNHVCVDAGPLQAIGTGLTIAGGLMIVGWFYLTYSKWANMYSHRCAECGRYFRDRYHLSEHTVDGLELCSNECALRVGARNHVEFLRGMIQDLEGAAMRSASHELREGAVRRLRELAAEPLASVRDAANAALKRIGEQ